MDTVSAVYTKATEATAERGDEYWKAGRDPATVYYYSEEEPTVEGNYWHYDENGNPAIWE